MKKCWGILIILTGILRTFGNRTFVLVGAFYFSGIFNLEYSDVWHYLVNDYRDTMNFYFSLLQIVPFCMALYIYLSTKRIKTEDTIITSSRYVHFGLVIFFIPAFATLGTSCYFIITRFIFNYYDLHFDFRYFFLHDFLTIINAWPIVTPLLHPNYDFYLIDGATLLILSYYLLPSNVKTKNFSNLRKAGPIMALISIPALLIGRVVLWEAIDDPLIEYNNPFLWAVHHQFLLITLLIFLISTVSCGIYAIRTAYEVLEEGRDIPS